MSFQVTVHRVVNIFDKRSPVPRPGTEYDRSFNDDQWHGGPRSYQEGRDFHDEDYPPNDRRYYDDNPNFRRNSPQPRNVRQACNAWFTNYNLLLQKVGKKLRDNSQTSFCLNVE